MAKQKDKLGDRRNRPGGMAGLCSRKYPLVYLSIPKSGCTTVKNLIYYIDNGAYYPNPTAIHGDNVALLNKGSPDGENFAAALRDRRIVFTFVREPFSRAYSAFNEKFYYAGERGKNKARKCLIQNYGAIFPERGQAYSPADHRANFMRFLDFVQDSIRGDAPLPLNPHWAPQRRAIMSHSNRMGIDVIGKLENFEATMQFILKAANVDVTVDLSVRFNEGPKPPFSLDQIIDAEVYGKLSQVYDVDVDYFGYRSESQKWAR